MIKLRIEKVEEDPNDKPIDLLNSFSKYLKSKGIKVSDVSYDNKAVYIEDEKDINDALRILKSKFKDLYQLGGTVRSDIKAGGIDKLVPQANESLKESNDFEEYTYIKSKEVYDSDGWLTEYTMYYDEVNDRYVFVFGDSDIYDPNDGYEEFDWECDTERGANEWFDSYNGFEDDLDESLTEDKYDLSWKEVGNEIIYIDDERLKLPIYEKRVYNHIVIQVVPEETDGELIWTVYYTSNIGKAGFKLAETGFFSSGEAMDYVDNELISKFDIFNIQKESKSEIRENNYSIHYFVTDDDYIPLKAQPDEGYTKLQAIQRAQREAEQSAKLFKMSVTDTAKWYHIMDSNNNILHDLDNAI